MTKDLEKSKISHMLASISTNEKSPVVASLSFRDNADDAVPTTDLDSNMSDHHITGGLTNISKLNIANEFVANESSKQYTRPLSPIIVEQLNFSINGSIEGPNTKETALIENSASFDNDGGAEIHVIISDPGQLFWVPAHQHPELAPAGYEEMISRRNAAKQNQQEPPTSPLSERRFSLQRTPSAPIRTSSQSLHRLSVVRRRLSYDSAFQEEETISLSIENSRKIDCKSGSTTLKRRKAHVRNRSSKPSSPKTSDFRSPETPLRKRSSTGIKISLELNNPAIKSTEITQISEDPTKYIEQSVEICNTAKVSKQNQTSVVFASDTPEQEPESPPNSPQESNNASKIQKRKNVYNILKQVVFSRKFLTTHEAIDRRSKPSKWERELSRNQEMQNSLYAISHQKLSKPRELSEQVLISNLIFELIKQKNLNEVSSKVVNHIDEKLKQEVIMQKTAKERERLAKKREKGQRSRARRKIKPVTAATSKSEYEYTQKTNSLSVDNASNTWKNIWIEEDDDYIEERRHKFSSSDEEADNTSDSPHPISSDSDWDGNCDAVLVGEDDDEKPLGLLLANSFSLQ